MNSYISMSELCYISMLAFTTGIEYRQNGVFAFRKTCKIKYGIIIGRSYAPPNSFATVIQILSKLEECSNEFKFTNVRLDRMM